MNRRSFNLKALFAAIGAFFGIKAKAVDAPKEVKHERDTNPKKLRVVKFKHYAVCNADELFAGVPFETGQANMVGLWGSSFRMTRVWVRFEDKMALCCSPTYYYGEMEAFERLYPTGERYGTLTIICHDTLSYNPVHNGNFWSINKDGSPFHPPSLSCECGCGGNNA